MGEGNRKNVELLLGPYRCGKTSLLIDELLSVKRKDPFSKVLVLVPSARYGRIFKERLRQRMKAALESADLPQSGSTTPGIFALDIQPFYQCCLGILSRASIVPRIIPEEIRPAIVGQLLAQMKAKKELVGLSAIAEFHGTSASILELIDELQRAGLTPDRVIARLEASSCRESQLLELARIYERFAERLKELDYFDQKSLALKAREQLFSCREKEYDLIIIDGFDRISHLQAQIFAGLAQRSALTAVSFDYVCPDAAETGLSPLRQSREDYRWKDGSYDELLSSLNPTIRLIEDAGSDILPEVEAASLLDPFLEMSEVARQIKAAIRDRKLSPSELIVVARLPDSYQGAIEAAFEDAGVSYFIDGSSKINDLEPWRFIRRLLGLFANDFKRKDLIDLLRSPYMKLESLGMTAREVSLLDRNSFEAKLIGGASAWERFLQAEEYTSFAVPLAGLFAALADEGRPQSTEEHARRIEDLIDRYMTLPGSDKLSSASACAERETIKALRRGLKVLILQDGLLNQGEEPFRQFFARLLSFMEKANYARPRPQAPAVTICSAELVPNISFREIYLCGLIEGDFPRHQSASEFLSPEQTRLWLSFGINIKNPRHEPGFERALFYSLSERAHKKLSLSLMQFTTKGEETIPSFYLDELARKTGLSCRRVAPFAGCRRPSSIREALSSALWQGGVAGAQQIANLHDAVNKRWQELTEPVAALLARSTGSLENQFNGYLGEFFQSAALVLPEETVWTASKVNDYGKCPFRFWSTHVLDLKPREEAESGLNFALVGQFYHKVLEFFFSALSGRQNDSKRVSAPDWSAGVPPAFSPLQQVNFELEPAALEQRIESAFDRGIGWLEARDDFQPGPYWAQEKTDLHFRIDRFIRKELERLSAAGAFSPRLFEANFGLSAPGSFPALVLPGAEGGRIVVRGSIDRVDLSPQSSEARIVDYKSGSKSITLMEVEQGRNLQLPLYALALEQCIMPGTSVSAADYVSIRAARSIGHMDFASEKHAGVKAKALDYLQKYTSAVNRGLFTVSPNGRDVCANCIQSSACRVSELQPQSGEEADAATD